MISRHTFAFAATVALVLCAVAPPAAPQDPPPPTPAPSAVPSPAPPRPPLVDIHPARPVSKQTFDRYKGRVLVFNIAQIVVQSTENEKMIWSFQYSPELREKVADMLSGRGYQYGDKVQIYCNPGTMVAVRFKGKPSKSS
jgi:hypothetical protein